jgi:hypothetical protein
MRKLLCLLVSNDAALLISVNAGVCPTPSAFVTQLFLLHHHLLICDLQDYARELVTNDNPPGTNSPYMTTISSGSLVTDFHAI